MGPGLDELAVDHMDDTLRRQLEQNAKFKVGDLVMVNGLERGKVVNRFFRRSTRQFVYEILGRYHNVTVKVTEDRLAPRPY